MRIPLFLLLILTACATRFEPEEHYSEALRTNPRYESSRTTILFLVDGLSFQTLQPALLKGRLPQIQRHFFSQQNSRLYRAHTLFPSLTFPALSSLLHEAPVNQTGALGNTLLSEGHIASFESVGDRPHFSQTMTGDTVFARLKAKGQKSVSLDYGLGVDASVAATMLDLKIGLAAGLEDYLYLDQKKLESLKIIFSETPVSEWPEFVFIHLVGLDFISHQFGPQSLEAFRYLESLDASLKDVFQILREAEAEKTATKRHEVISMLTADHGFSAPVKKSVDLETLVRKVSPELVVFNEHRMASVYARTSPTREQLKKWSTALVTKAGVEIIAFRIGNEIQLKSANLTLTLTLVKGDCPHHSMAVSIDSAAPLCPGDVDNSRARFKYPFLIENLVYFFQTLRYPDFIVIPERNTVFHQADGGFHGGPTQEEVYIPLLLRNAALAAPKTTPAIWDLLKFL